MTARRKALTPEQKKYQGALSKIKRLNLKLSDVKQITEAMIQAEQSGKPISQKQLQGWIIRLKKIVNIKNETTE